MSPQDENREGMEGLEQQTWSLKQDSVNSTQNAVQLGDQSEKVADAGRHLDVSKGHSQRAEDKTDMMKQLNRFRPVVTFSNDAKQAAQDAKVQTRYEDCEEREKAMVDIREMQCRLGRATTYGITDDGDDQGIGGSRRMETGAQLLPRKEQRKRFQFESTSSDGEMEDELDDNLDEISHMMKQLEALRSAMEQELNGMQANCLALRCGRSSGTEAGNIDKRNEKLKRIK
ncbi:hypothetical protein EWM64_g10198 [Hericium alpestre]|uniref:t-SNARE coiled-coil homology domain-containing protein n=1 Tax=Hericium alpestre TaxID=135208 RepID=A0A4Y9ZIW2_9AGAM|nr:hypothetical protein EWM64_g10198 [Hericium alpestre]